MVVFHSYVNVCQRVIRSFNIPIPWFIMLHQCCAISSPTSTMEQKSGHPGMFRMNGGMGLLMNIIELDDGKIYRKAPYFMVKTMVSCRFSLKPIQWEYDQHFGVFSTGHSCDRYLMACCLPFRPTAWAMSRTCRFFGPGGIANVGGWRLVCWSGDEWRNVYPLVI